MVHLLPISAFFLYLLAALLFLLNIIQKKSAFYSRGVLVHRIGFLIQTASLLPFMYDNRLTMLENGGDFYYWLSWLLSFTYFVFGRRLEYPIIGTLLASVTALFMLSSSYLVHLNAARFEQSSIVFLVVHVLPALIAEVNLVFAFIVSCAYLWYERRLKRKGGDVLLSGPSLEVLEVWNRRFVLIGFVAMSAAIVSGCLWSFGFSSRLQFTDVLQWVAVVAWVLLATILHARLTLRWSAHRVSQVTVLVTGLFFFSFFIMLLSTGNVLHDHRVVP